MQPNSRLSEALAAFKRGELPRARALARAQLEAEQGPPEVNHLLGLIECREGRIKEGVAHFRAALDAQPENAAFRLMLARALVDSGSGPEALEVATAPAEVTAAALALWHVRAEAAQASSDHAAAAEAWKIVTAARPDDWRGWTNYAEALAAMGQWEAAANMLRKAWALNPSDIGIQLNFAAALTKAGFHAEAAEQLRDMLDSGGDDPRVRLTLSRLLADLGRHQESVAELDKAARLATGEAAFDDCESLIRIALPGRSAEAGPVSADELRAVRELALLLERTNRLDALATLLDEAEEFGVSRDMLGYPAAARALRAGDPKEAKRLLELESSDTDPVRWHRLMAKILEAAGDTAGAFAAAATMNRSAADFDQWVRRGADYRRRLRAMARDVTPEWAGNIRPLGPGPRRTPAFLVGFPRSGTTLLDTFLMGHPDTEVLEEFPMLRTADSVLNRSGGHKELSAERLGEARRAYFEELDRHTDRTDVLVVDKMPFNMLRLPLIYGLFPDARVIFAQRHPCDCVLSGFMQSFTLNDAMASFLTIEGAAELYNSAMDFFSRARDALPLAVHTLVYEQLVADPEAALRPLIEFLGLAWKPELLDHRSTAKARGAIITPSYDQVVEPLSKAPSGRWRRYQKQLAPVLPVLLPWAERLGYAD